MKNAELEHLSVHGRATKEQKELVRKAVKFYANKLLSKQMVPHVSVIVKLKRKISGGLDGDCEVIGYNSKNKPRHFIVRLVFNKDTELRKVLSVLAHEMVHVKQFAKGEVDLMLTTWCGTNYPEDTNYWDHPWEIDAFGRQVGLYTRFAKKYKLSSRELSKRVVKCPKRK